MPRRRFRTRINTGYYVAGRSRSVGLLFLLAASTASGWAGTRLNLESSLQQADMAVLASGKHRADFSCQVTSDKPGLGFDLRFPSRACPV